MARMDVRVAALLALVSATFLFVGLDRYGVVNADEGIYHGIAERMVETGDWLSLDFRGQPRLYDTFMNAPLHYWGRASLIAAFGSNGYTMRGLSALFGVLAVLATYGLGCRLVGRRAALLGAGVLLTSFQFVYLHGARTGELDTIATFLMVAIAWAFLRGVQEGKSFLPHHVALAALGMTKLPLVIVPLAAELAWWALHPAERRHLQRFVVSALCVAPFALLWHGAQAWILRDRVAEIFGTMLGQASGARDALGRPAATSGFGPLDNTLFYAKALLYGALPWAAAYPFAIAAAFAPADNAAGRRDALLFASALGLFFVVVSKSFSWYLLPAHPFLSIAVGAWLADGIRRDPPLWAGIGAGAIGAACLWLAVGALDTNPFDKLGFRPRFVARDDLGFGAWTSIAVVGGGWAAAWTFGARRLPAAARRGLGIAFAAALFAYAGVRVVTPLAHLDHRSRAVQVRAEIDRALAEGRPLEYPIPIGRLNVQTARFLFGEDFEITKVGRGPQLVLHAQGDPKVIRRSLGRGGHEWRRARKQRRPASP